MTQATTMRQRQRFSSRMTRIVLLISFMLFFGRFIYSAVGAWYHHQGKQQLQQISLSLDAAPQQR